MINKTIGFSEEQIERIEKQAKIEMRDFSNMVRYAVDKYLKEVEEIKSEKK